MGFSAERTQPSYVPGVLGNYWGPKLPDTWRHPRWLRKFDAGTACSQQRRKLSVGKEQTWPLWPQAGSSPTLTPTW